TAVTLRVRGREQRIEQDEPPFKCDPSRIATLKPAFDPDGTVTAASSSSLADGAAALVLMSEAAARAAGAPTLGRLVAWAGVAQAPEWFTTAPAGAIRGVLERAGWRDADVDLYEINEAFAVVTLAAMRDLSLDAARVNVHGGACALGHPIGASGARIITTLLHALRRRGGGRGVAALCIGGGEATAVAIEAAAPERACLPGVRLRRGRQHAAAGLAEADACRTGALAPATQRDAVTVVQEAARLATRQSQRLRAAFRQLQQ